MGFFGGTLRTEGRVNYEQLGHSNYDWGCSIRDYGYTVYSFLIFSKTSKPPAIIKYLGAVLPAAVMGLLVVYSLKDVTLWTYPHGLPELLAILALVVIHLVKRNMLLSIATGTIVYMLLIQQVFVK